MSALREPLADRGVLTCALACVLGFVGFLAWSVAFPLDEGVHASGQIVVRDDRKVVQHYEGGIVAELGVGEGSVVEAGDVLLVLAPLQSEAARDELAQEVALQTAIIERATALASGGTPRFERSSALSAVPTVREDIEARQRTLFEEQRGAHEAAMALLATRRAGLSARAENLSAQLAATRVALRAGREDLALRTQLLDERLETIGKVQSLSREVAQLEADLTRIAGARQEALSRLAEVDDEARAAEATLREQAGREVVEAQARLLTARERLRGTEDRLARTVITAPITGEVLNLAASTIGGVVTRGEPIMEIVPTDGALVAEVRLRPIDRDAVRPGQRVEAQLTAYKSFVPSARLEGRVVGVSADLVEDEATATSYYAARMVLDQDALDPRDAVEVLPGMPVDAFIASGRSRTFMSYVVEPIAETVRRGSRMD